MRLCARRWGNWRKGPPVSWLWLAGFAAATAFSNLAPLDRMISIIGSALAVAAAISLPFAIRSARLLSTGGAAAVLYALRVVILGSPAALLIAGILAGLALYWIWTTEYDIRAVTAAPPNLWLAPIYQGLRRILILNGISWLVLESLAPRGHPASGWAAAAAGASAWLFAVLLTVPALRLKEFKGWPGAICTALGLAAMLAMLSDPWWVGRIGLVSALATAIVVVPEPAAASQTSWWQLLLEHPARFLVTTFLALCVAGSFLLALPVSAAGDLVIAPLDAAFTAVSAVCVTGLIVLDTPKAFSGAGQSFLLVFIQLGGLGIMTFSTAAMGILGRRVSLRHETALSSMLTVEDRADLFQALRRLFLVTFGMEAAGAVFLSLLFLGEGDALPQAVWRGLFTAISAFCNAGFALQTNSLIPYQENPWILHTVAALIIAGGLSPAVIVSLPLHARGRRVSAQSRLILAATAILLVGGTILFGIIEWRESLESLSLADRLHNAWFQSTTLRTAGFNSVDYASLAPASISLMMALMFIGGSPGGTAGGTKTTTAALLLLAVGAAIRGSIDVTIFSRRIPQEIIYRAASIATMGIFSVLALLISVQVTQDMPFATACFEVVSALATVGLSIGGTPLLDEVGKMLIMLGMFAGRVGPLTLFIFLAGRSESAIWQYPDEQVDVG